MLLIKSLVFKRHQERRVRLSFFRRSAYFWRHQIVLSDSFFLSVALWNWCFCSSKFAFESIVVSGVSWLVFPIPNIHWTRYLLSASKNEELVLWGVVLALGSLSGVAGKLCSEEFAGYMGDYWMPQRLAKLSRASWAPSWFSNSGTQS